MRKKGVSQLDWIMSMALFLLYVAWFFIFMAPSLNLSSNKDSMIVILKNNFKNDFDWGLNKYPLFIESNNSYTMKPIIMEYLLNKTNIKFVDGTDFIIWNDKLIFLANMTSTRQIFWILEGENSSSEYNFEGINIEEDIASVENMSVWFESSLPDNIIYKDSTKIENIDYKINDVPFVPINSSYNDSGFVGIFMARTESINHTSFVFAYNTLVDNFITMETSGSEYSFEIDLELDEYSSYYSNNLYYGDFLYDNASQSISYFYDYVTFYTSSDSLSLFFDEEAEFNFSYYNTTLNVKIIVPITDDFNYKYIFNEGNYLNAFRSDYATRFGVVENLEGLYLENITTNYTYLKNKWKFPSKRDFNIRVYSNSSAYSYLQSAPSYEIGTFNAKSNVVYSETEDMFALNNDGTYTPIYVNYRIW